MIRLFYIVSILSFLVSCTKDVFVPTDVNYEVEGLAVRNDGRTDCCNFLHDLDLISSNGDCCVYFVSIWVDLVRCPITVYGPNGWVGSSSKSYFSFAYNSCDNPELVEASFQVYYDDPIDQVSKTCRVITLDLNC